MIAKHEAPTVRLPARLPSKPTGNSPSGRIETPATEDGEEPSDDGIFDRAYEKTTSINNVRKQTKHLKADESRLLIATL